MPLFTLAQLDEKAKTRPQGYRDEVLAAATLLPTGFYELATETFEALALKYRAPTFFDKLVNVSEAALQVLANPAHRSLDELRKVTAICQVCPWFKEESFSCGHCGCDLHFKPVMKAWHCPIGKWD